MSRKPLKKSKSGTSSGFDEAAVTTLAESLLDEDDPELISMEGISMLSEQLEINPESDVRLLVLLWKLGASSKPGAITKTEFIEGMKTIRKNSVSDLKSHLATLDPGFLERPEFREFYKFVFQFSREGTYKTIEKEVVSSLLPIVLDTNRAPHLESFLEFMKGCKETRITMDQWDSFLQFNYTVNYDCKNYDDDGAWPLLLDEYVEYRKEGK